MKRGDEEKQKEPPRTLGSSHSADLFSHSLLCSSVAWPHTEVERSDQGGTRSQNKSGYCVRLRLDCLVIPH